MQGINDEELTSFEIQEFIDEELMDSKTLKTKVEEATGLEIQEFNDEELTGPKVRENHD